jgi:hypothetical protein
LLKALDQVDWRVAGRPVRLKLLTPKLLMASRGRARVDYLGFRPPHEVQAVLAGCHATYMPQPFVEHLRELSRYSFPTKLTNYLALGRPVFVHAPRDGALSAFFAGNPIGAHADSLEPQPILAALEGLLGDAAAYDQACRQVRTSARRHFDVPVFHAAIDRLLAEPAPA